MIEIDFTEMAPGDIAFCKGYGIWVMVSKILNESNKWYDIQYLSGGLIKKSFYLISEGFDHDVRFKSNKWKFFRK